MDGNNGEILGFRSKTTVADNESLCVTRNFEGKPA